MAEIIGLIASATQLAQYAFNIISMVQEMKKRVHGTPEWKGYAVQIQQLVETVLQIKQNDKVHSDVVRQHIDTCIIEAQLLQGLLEKVLADYTTGSMGRRYFKAARGTKESKIATGFINLEREKNSLIVCIAISNTERLVSIQDGVQRLVHRPLHQDRMLDQQKSRQEYGDEDDESSLEGEVHSTIEHDGAINGLQMEARTSQYHQNYPRSMQSLLRGGDSTQNNALAQRQPTANQLCPPPNPQNSRWDSTYNGPSCPQIEGSCSPPSSQLPTMSNASMGQHVNPSRCVWEDNEAIGSLDVTQRPSRVHNGNFDAPPGENIYRGNKARDGGVMGNGSAYGADGLAAMNEWWKGATKTQVQSKGFFWKKN